MIGTDWLDVGTAADFAALALPEITLGRTKLALSNMLISVCVPAPLQLTFLPSGVVILL